MKRLLYIYCFILLFASGCVKETSIMLWNIPKEIILGPDATEEKINLSIDAPWDIRSSADWLTLSPTYGESGDFLVKLVAEANYDSSKREAEIKIISENLEYVISVVQTSKQEEPIKEYIDLSRAGTANCYIVSEEGYYKFLAVKGNSLETFGEYGIGTAEVLWETYGTDVLPAAGDLVSDVHYSDGYVFFKASGKKGNASIAVKNDWKILWSWHIWMTDQPEDQVYRNGAGTMMDRNLGATSVTPGDIKAAGLLYQWGRKDPFLTGGNYSLDLTQEFYACDRAASANDWVWGTIVSDASSGTIEYATEYPTVFIINNTNNSDWLYSDYDVADETRWQSAKTIYDPCPIGYRVPDGGEDGVWARAMGGDTIADETYNTIDFCFNLGSGSAYKLTDTAADCWYPLSGYMYRGDANLNNVGGSGSCWSCTPRENVTTSRFRFRIEHTDRFKAELQNSYSNVGPIGAANCGNAYSVRCYKEGTSFSDSFDQEAVNLSETGTANCYIVSKQGNYKFAAVQGNSSTSVGNVASAEVLWETFGTATAPSIGDLVSNVKYADGYISFKASSKKGNASIAAKDASGNILWSWHIWMTDKPEDQVYNNNAGTMMDRNLGAVSATPGDVGALGLMYQWGRKDPFLGSSSISSNSKAGSTITWPTSLSSDASIGTIAYSIAYPTTFICFNSNNYDWYYTGDSSTDNTRWQSSKTIYDPCPVGYRVPDGGETGVWSTAFGTSSSFDEDAFDSTNNGFNFGSSISTNRLTNSSSTCWYPADGYLDAGVLSNGDGSLYGVGRGGDCWSCSPYGSSHAYSLSFGYNGYVYPSIISYRANGQAVRCLRE